MMADILLTKQKVNVPIVLPPIGRDLSTLMCFVGGQPVGLAQKIYILNGKVCIGLAGTVFELKKFLEDFKVFCNTAPDLNEFTVEKFLSQYDYSGFQNSAYFAMVIDRKGDNIHVREITYSTVTGSESPPFENTRAIGSGSDGYISQITLPATFTSSFKDGELAQAVVKNQSFIARLLANERYTLDDVTEQWGGGFEWAYFDGDKFQKFDQVAYLLHQGVYNDQGKMEFVLPLMINYYAYEDGYLVITSIEVHDLSKYPDTSVVRLWSQGLTVRSHVVPPIWAENEMPDHLKTPKSFQTYRMALAYSIHTPKQNIVTPSLFTFSTALHVMFSKEKKILEIEMSLDLEDFLKEKFAEIYNL
jgi:hypothetical protein